MSNIIIIELILSNVHFHWEFPFIVSSLLFSVHTIEKSSRRLFYTWNGEKFGQLLIFVSVNTSFNNNSCLENSLEGVFVDL